jgi:hypothetical protein
VLSRDGDDDVVRATGEQRLDGPRHERAAGQVHQRLRAVRPQTQTTPGRCDDADSVHGSGQGDAE